MELLIFGVFLLVLATFVLWIPNLISWYKASPDAFTCECPDCHGKTNYLTLSGNCQECEWEKIAARRKEATRGIGMHL